MASETISNKLDRLGRQGYPQSASVEVTARCNAQCEYCYLKDVSFKELSTQELCAAILKLSDNGVYHLHCTGGEPFLRPDILTVLSFAMENGILACTLFTNGTLLSQEHLDFLTQHKDFFRTVQMSVFSHDPMINDSYFGVKGALETVVKNALFLQENGLRAIIALTICDFNLETMEETRRFLESRGLSVALAYFKTVTGPRLRRVLAQSNTYDFFKRYLLNLRPEEIERDKQRMKESLAKPPQLDAEMCFGRWNAVFMNAQGDLAPCISFRNVNLGNVLEERSLRDILQQAPDYHSICSIRKRDMKKCVQCKFYNFCIICLGNIHTENNSLCGLDDQMCNYAQALFDLTY